MTFYPGLAQMFLGPGEPPGTIEDVDFEPPKDPITELLLDSPRVDDRTKAFLRQQRHLSNRQARIKFDIAKLERDDEKLDKPGLIDWWGPIPNFQIGTWLGVKNEWARFALDIFADPLNFIGLGFTRLGRAARFLQGLSPAAKARQIQKGVKLLGLAGVDDAARKSLQELAAAQDVEGITAFARKAERLRFKEDEFQKMLDVGMDKGFVSFLRDLQANPRKTFKDMRSAFAQDDRLKAVEQAPGLIEGIKKGQIGLSAGIPLTDVEFVLDLPGIRKRFQKEPFGKSVKKALGEAPIAFKGIKGQIVDTLDLSKSEALFDDLSQSVSLSLDSISGKAMYNLSGSDDMEKAGQLFGDFVDAQLNISDIAKRRLTLSLRGIAPDLAVRKQITNALEHPRAAARLAPHHQNVVTEMDRLFEGFRERAVEEHVFREFVENYVPHVVKWKGGKTDQEAKLLRHLIAQAKRDTKAVRRGRKGAASRFALPRVFSTLQALKRYQKKNPLLLTIEEDIAEIAPRYLDSMATAIIKNDALRAGQNMKAADGLPLIVRAGRKFEGKLYTKIDNPNYEAFRFHVDAAKPLQAILGKDWMADMGRIPKSGHLRLISGLNTLNSLGKTSIFSLSALFHAAALTKSALATLPPGAAGRTIAQSAKDVGAFVIAKFKNDEEAINRVIQKIHTRAYVADGKTMVNAADIDRLMGIAGVKLGEAGRASDAPGFDLFKRGFQAAADALPAPPLINPMTHMVHYIDAIDRGLWSVYQTGLKRTTFAHLYHAEVLRNPKVHGNQTELFKMLRDIGAHVDNSFGSQNWNRVIAHPIVKTIMRWGWIAPDWTTSNQRVGWDMFLNMPGVRQLIGPFLRRDVAMADARFRWSLGYNVRAAFYMGIFGNLVSQAFTGKFLWEQDDEAIDENTGLKLRIELPYKRGDGRRLYMDISKQFTEPLKLVRNPLEFYTRKMGVVPRVVQTLVVGRDSLGNEVMGTEGGPYQQIIGRIAATTGQFIPIPVQSLFEYEGDFKDPRSIVLSNIGFPVSRERKAGFDKRKRIDELKKEAARLNGFVGF